MDTPSIPQKRCTKCGIEYPATAEYFHVSSHRPGGLYSCCKTCKNAQVRQRRSDPEIWQRDLERNRERNRERYHTNSECRKRKIETNKKRWSDPNIRKKMQESRHKRRAKPEVRQRERASAEVKRSDPNFQIRNKKYQKKYRDSERGQIVTRANKVRRRTHGGKCTKQDIQMQIHAQTDFRGRLICWWCDQPIKGKFHIDHRIPLSRGGSNDARNLCITHGKCNLSKHDKLPQEYNGRLL